MAPGQSRQKAPSPLLLDSDILCFAQNIVDPAFRVSIGPGAAASFILNKAVLRNGGRKGREEGSQGRKDGGR